MSTSTRPAFLADMRFRGQIAQVTHEEQLDRHLASLGPACRAYAGFDPTADSLTIGNLVTILALVRFQLAGHTPVVLMGGGTGLIGDPSGKSAERQLMTPETVAANVRSQRRIFDSVWANAGGLVDDSGGASLAAPRIVNNLDWLGKLGYLEVLRDVGKFFSVNMMIQKDSVKERLNNRDQGISYTEFSYMILQAYDFAHLFEHDAVTLQLGGSDQFGNIVCGIDLIWRRLDVARGTAVNDESKRAFGLTWPLVTKADGGKFGKTESGAIWLTPERTSPYAFYQFWLNAADADVPKFLRTFTLLGHARIEELERAHAANPGAREAHRELARHMTTLLHGKHECEQAEAAAAALFSGDIAGLPEATLREIFAAVPSTTHAKSLLAGEGASLLDLLVETKLAASKREAKDFLAAGSVMVNGKKAGADSRLTASDLLHGKLIAIRRGKKNWHLSKWE